MNEGAQWNSSIGFFF